MKARTLGVVLVVCLAGLAWPTAGGAGQENPPPGAVQPSQRVNWSKYSMGEDGLKTLMADFSQAAKGLGMGGQESAALVNQWFRGLDLYNSREWFRNTFGEERAQPLEADYRANRIKDINDLTQVGRLIAAEGADKIRIKSYTGPGGEGDIALDSDTGPLIKNGTALFVVYLGDTPAEARRKGRAVYWFAYEGGQWRLVGRLRALPPSTSGLSERIEDILAALKAGDKAKAMELIKSLAMTNPKGWFADNFDAEGAAKLTPAYTREAAGMAGRLMAVMEKAAKDGQTRARAMWGLGPGSAYTVKQEEWLTSHQKKAADAPPPFWRVTLMQPQGGDRGAPSARGGGSVALPGYFGYADGQYRWVGTLGL